MLCLQDLHSAPLQSPERSCPCLRPAGAESGGGGGGGFSTLLVKKPGQKMQAAASIDTGLCCKRRLSLETGRHVLLEHPNESFCLGLTGQGEEDVVGLRCLFRALRKEQWKPQLDLPLALLQTATACEPGQPIHADASERASKCQVQSFKHLGNPHLKLASFAVLLKPKPVQAAPLYSPLTRGFIANNQRTSYT